MGSLATLRWRCLAPGVVLGVATTFALAAEGPEAKRTVTFSDSKEDGVRVDVAAPTPLFQRNTDPSRRGGSSLDGVGAAPFVPLPNLLPGAVSRRDRESRDARSNWILDAAKGLAITEESANRAFGVRSAETDWGGKESDRPASFWEAYFGKKERKDTTRSPAMIESPFKERSKEGSGADTLRRFQPPGRGDAEDAAIPLGEGQRKGVFFSDTSSEAPALGTLADALDDTRRDLVSDNLNYNQNLNATSSQTEREARAAARAEQFRRLLGLESSPLPSEAATPQARGGAAPAEAGAVRKPLGSPDLIGVAPDPTRQELNPVIARPAPDLGVGSRLSFTDSISGLRPHPAAQPRSLIDMSPVRSLQPAGTGPNLGSANSARRATHSPTSLEIPRRSF
jgi:hypothetical protein